MTPALANELLDYDPDTGELTWRVRGLEHCLSVGVQKVFNSKSAGKVAGTLNSAGYIVIGLYQKKYYAHRLIWFMENEYWPTEIDHKNRIKHDNRWKNLREVTFSENQLNKGMHPSNTSGHKGVSVCRGGWEARFRGKQIGIYETIEGAIVARHIAETQHKGSLK